MKPTTVLNEQIEENKIRMILLRQLVLPAVAILRGVVRQIGAYAASMVPEPATMMLLGLGLMGLLSIRRKIRK